MTGMIGSGIRATLFQYQHTWKVELIIRLVSIELKQSTLFFLNGELLREKKLYKCDQCGEEFWGKKITFLETIANQL